MGFPVLPSAWEIRGEEEKALASLSPHLWQLVLPSTVEALTLFPQVTSLAPPPPEVGLAVGSCSSEDLSVPN